LASKSENNNNYFDVKHSADDRNKNNWEIARHGNTLPQMLFTMLNLK